MPIEKSTLYLPRPLVNQILAHAQKNPETEVCGLIGNDSEENKTYYPIQNVAENPHCRFLMDAPQQIEVMKTMRERQQQLFAIVHSHPKSDAHPSRLDLEENNYKDAFYIIISLNTKGVLEMRAFTQDENRMHEIELILEDS